MNPNDNTDRMVKALESIVNLLERIAKALETLPSPVEVIEPPKTKKIEPPKIDGPPPCTAHHPKYGACILPAFHPGNHRGPPPIADEGATF